MVIVSQNRSDMYNLSHVVNIYLDGIKVKVCTDGSTRGGILGEYKTQDVAWKAFEWLADQLETEKSVIRMPSGKYIEDRYRSALEPVKQRAANGKKTVRRGGS